VTLPRHSEPWWMITRISGAVLIAMVLATVTVGILLAVRRVATQARGQARLHRRLSWFALALVAVHIGAALLDRRHVPPYALVAPFLSPTRRIAAGTGSLAVWGVVIVTLSAAGRRWLRPSWRKIHYLAYPACALAVWHSLLGSDAHVIAFWLGLWSGALLVPVVPKVRSAWTNRTKPVEGSSLSTAPSLVAVASRGDRGAGVVPAAPPSPVCPPLQPDEEDRFPLRLEDRENRPEVATSASDEVSDALWANAIEANRSLDEALAKFRLRRSLPDRGMTDVQRLLGDLRDTTSSTGGSRTDWAIPRMPPSAPDVARQLLLDRGLTVRPDVARRMAEHLLAPPALDSERSAEFRLRRNDGEEVSVVITATDLLTAIEVARSRLPRPSPGSFAQAHRA